MTREARRRISADGAVDLRPQQSHGLRYSSSLSKLTWQNPRDDDTWLVKPIGSEVTQARRREVDMLGEAYRDPRPIMLVTNRSAAPKQ